MPFVTKPVKSIIMYFTWLFGAKDVCRHMSVSHLIATTPLQVPPFVAEKKISGHLPYTLQREGKYKFRGLVIEVDYFG